MSKVVGIIAKGLVILAGLLLILLLASFIFSNNKGSNADLNPQPDAILRCVNVSGTNVTIQWEYPYLNESDSYNAYVFASMNNCTFKSERFTIKELVEGNISITRMGSIDLSKLNGEEK